MRGTPGRGTGSRLLRALALAALLPVVLAGCGGGGTSGAASNAGTSSPAPVPAVLSASALTPSGLTATLTESAATVPVGGGVTYTLTLTNNTSHPITFSPVSFGSSPASTMTFAVGGTLIITSQSGGTVYPPQNAGPTPSGTLIGPPTTLAPGQSAVGTVAPGPVFGVAGTYSATATFKSEQPFTTVGPLTVTVQ